MARAIIAASHKSSRSRQPQRTVSHASVCCRRARLRRIVAGRRTSRAWSSAPMDACMRQPGTVGGYAMRSMRGESVRLHQGCRRRTAHIVFRDADHPIAAWRSSRTNAIVHSAACGFESVVTRAVTLTSTGTRTQRAAGLPTGSAAAYQGDNGGCQQFLAALGAGIGANKLIPTPQRYLRTERCFHSGNTSDYNGQPIYGVCCLRLI
jgi:hypothetical protein